MAYVPVSGIVPQYQVDGDTIAAGYWLKGYTSETTTPLAMATDLDGGTTLAKCKLNTAAYPLSNSSDDTSVFIPHFNVKYKLALYPTETDADNNTTGNAVWIVDKLPIRNDIWVSVTDFLNSDGTAVLADGTQDDTTGVQAASDSAPEVLYFPGYCKITDKVTFPSGMRLIGSGRHNSGFVIESDFNLAATGCIEFTGGEPGPSVEHLGIKLAQVSTETVRANLVQYPAAILAADTPRFNIDTVRIEGALTGIDMTGNSGGAHIDNFECCAFTIGISVAASLDFIFLDNVEFWPFGNASGNILTSIYQDGTTIGLQVSGALNTLAAGTISSFNNRIILNDGQGSISTLQLDGSYARLEVGASSLYDVGTLYSTSSAADDYAIKLTGTTSHLTVGTAYITNATNLTSSNGLIQMDGTAPSSLTIGELYVKTSGADTRVAHQSGTGNFTITGGYFELPQNTSFNEDLIDINAGKFTLANVRVQDKGTGTGNLIGILTEGRHVLSNIIAPAWPVSLPSNTEQMEISGCDWSTKVAGTRQLLGAKIHGITGTLDGSGNLTVAHGLAAPNTQFPIVNAWEISGANRVPVTIAQIDATNVVLSGGTASASIEIVIQVSNAV